MKNAFFLLLLFPTLLVSQTPALKLSKLNATASFRGLSVVDDKVIWAGGSRGTVCRSTNGGDAFTCLPVAGYDSSDFRSVYAFDENTAIICNTGSPAKILRTADGGKTWKEVYSNENAAAFIDGIDFWNEKEGVVHGDPIDGFMMVLTTNDGGQTWNEVPAEACPQLVEGEACFAASGTAIRCLAYSKVMIVSGGVASRLFVSNDKGNTWTWLPTPIIQGQESTGIFSFGFYDSQKGVIVGGDYKNEGLLKDHIFLTNDGGNNWQLPTRPTRGYRECVEYITDKQLIAVGPTGIDISKNGGLTWEPFSDENKFHVVRKARIGKLVVIAGGDGKIGLISLE